MARSRTNAPPAAHAADKGRGGLPRWLEFAVALTALITSVSSIFIARQESTTQSKLLEASSIPYLIGGFSSATPEDREVLSFDLVNSGVGPAHEKSRHIKVDGRIAHSTAELIAMTLGPADAQQFTGDVLKDGVRTRFIPGGRTQMVFSIPRTAANAASWDRLAERSQHWSFDYCFCSVFDECWAVVGKWAEPEPVKECRRDEANQFLP